MPVESGRDRQELEIHLYLREDLVEALERMAEDSDMTFTPLG
jgi:hypothetical protein